MNAVLAIIADGGRAIIVIDREGVENNYFFLFVLILLKPFKDGLVQPLPHRLPGVLYFHPSKPCRWIPRRIGVLDIHKYLTIILHPGGHRHFSLPHSLC